MLNSHMKSDHQGSCPNHSISSEYPMGKNSRVNTHSKFVLVCYFRLALQNYSLASFSSLNTLGHSQMMKRQMLFPKRGGAAILFLKAKVAILPQKDPIRDRNGYNLRSLYHTLHTTWQQNFFLQNFKCFLQSVSSFVFFSPGPKFSEKKHLSFL